MKQVDRVNNISNLNKKKMFYPKMHSVYGMTMFGFLLGTSLLLLNQIDQSLAQDEKINEKSINVTNYNSEISKFNSFKSSQKSGYDLDTTSALLIIIGTFKANGANAIAILWSL